MSPIFNTAVLRPRCWSGRKKTFSPLSKAHLRARSAFEEVQTAPPFIPTIIGTGGKDWPAVAAGATLFLVPIMVFTILLRKHLLRGITFGAVRK